MDEVETPKLGVCTHAQIGRLYNCQNWASVPMPKLGVCTDANEIATIPIKNTPESASCPRG